MKIQIRQGCFETNSSSTHAFCIMSEKELYDFQHGTLNIIARTPEGNITKLPRGKHDGGLHYIWNWNDFTSQCRLYTQRDDIENFKDFPPGTVEALGNGQFKLHYQY